MKVLLFLLLLLLAIYAGYKSADDFNKKVHGEHYKEKMENGYLHMNDSAVHNPKLRNNTFWE
jgi:hypothetical protein